MLYVQIFFCETIQNLVLVVYTKGPRQFNLSMQQNL